MSFNNGSLSTLSLCTEIENQRVFQLKLKLLLWIWADWVFFEKIQWENFLLVDFYLTHIVSAFNPFDEQLLVGGSSLRFVIFMMCFLSIYTVNILKNAFSDFEDDRNKQFSSLLSLFISLQVFGNWITTISPWKNVSSNRFSAKWLQCFIITRKYQRSKKTSWKLWNLSRKKNFKLKRSFVNGRSLLFHLSSFIFCPRYVLRFFCHYLHQPKSLWCQLTFKFHGQSKFFDGFWVAI